MERSFRGVLGLLAPAMVVLSMGPAIGSAAERSGKPRADGEQIDLFVAMQQGQVDVQFIPQDENRCRLLVTNKTDKPLSVKLPDSFVARRCWRRRGTFPLATRWERTTSPASTTFQRGARVGAVQLEIAPTRRRRHGTWRAGAKRLLQCRAGSHAAGEVGDDLSRLRPSPAPAGDKV